VKAKVGKTIDIKRAHEISDSIEKEIKNKIKSIDLFNVSFEPFAVDKQKVAIPIDEDRGIDSQVSKYFGRAKKFIFIEIDKGEIKNHYVKDNPYKDRKVRAGLNVALFISEEKVDSVITKEMGHISLYTLRDSIVDVYLGIDGTISELIKELSSNKLKSLKEPTKKKL
jgi:predicted Fe-Mo cluster-binding NifX family protein